MTIRAGAKLSPREEEILFFIRTTDLSYFDIGRQVVPPQLSENTVKTHAKRAYQKLGVCGRVSYLVKVATHAA